MVTHLREKLVAPQSLPASVRFDYDASLVPDDLTPQGWERYRAIAEHRPVEQLCPTCKGIGHVLRPSERDGHYALGTRPEAVLMPCPTCGTEARNQWIAKHSGLEPSEQSSRLHQWRYKDLGNAPPVFVDQRQFARSCIEQALEMRSGLYTFWGDFGSGKTLALQIVVNEMRVLRSVEGFYAPFAVILDHLRQLWSRRLDSSDFWERLLSIPVLAVDEVTRFDEGKGWAREKLFALVDTRYRRRDSHLTLFGTNEDPNQNLSADESIGYLFSRMREGVMIELRGDVRAALTNDRRSM